MKQVFLQKGAAAVHDVPAPQLDENLVIVRVHYSFISSGTESATMTGSGESLLKKALKNPSKAAQKLLGALAENGIQGTRALIKGKQLGEISPIGYSCAGQVVAVGKNIKRFAVGDYVACAGAGLANHADVVAVPENLMVKVPSKEFLRQASITTIGAIALQGIRRADLRLGETVCVVGLGLLGQLTVQMAKLSGCRVIGVDLQPERVKLAHKLGADAAYVAHDVTLETEVAFATDNHGVDATIITAASSSGSLIDQAMNLTRRKGKVVLVGDVKIDFDRAAFYAKEIDFLISCSYGPGRYDSVYERQGQDYPYAYVRWTENRNMQLFVDLVACGQLSVDPLISHSFSILEAEKAYESLKGGSALGLVIDYDAFNRDAQQPVDVVKEVAPSVKARPYSAPEKEVRIGFVGAGGFARVKLLPLVKGCKQIKIAGIIDADIATATNVARQYLADTVGVDHRKLIDDDAVDAAVIATPHADHTDKALDFLRAGKAVFLEKPASITLEQLQRLETFFAVNPAALFTVDFNRSWAPFNVAARAQVAQRSTPLVAHYRMNAGFIPNTHWIQSEQHRGRIIGEACHIFELFCNLTQSDPVRVSVTSMQPQGTSLNANDNVSAQISFADGSCCTLLYTAVGNTQLSKERMELFFDGKSIIMDDYKELKGYGLPRSFNATTRSPDKGHAALVAAFCAQTRQRNPQHPIPLKRIFDATRISIIVDQLARTGGGSYDLAR